MPKEIERKFLVKGDGWREGAERLPIRQGYLAASETLAVRVRTVGLKGFLTVKGARNGLTRDEFEYEIPRADAEEMLDLLCLRPLIEKVRHRLTFAGRPWVVDVFEGDNEGLVLAEVELGKEDDLVALPDWAGEEVSHDPRYLNVNLARWPFRMWGRASA